MPNNDPSTARLASTRTRALALLTALAALLASQSAVAAYEKSLALFHLARYRPGEAWVHLGLAIAVAGAQPREGSVNYRLAAGIFGDLGMEADKASALTSAAALD